MHSSAFEFDDPVKGDMLMLSSIDPRLKFCSCVELNVRVCRSEGECRTEYGCTEPDCPLRTEFDLNAYDQRMRAFSSHFDLWPLTANAPPGL
jgi:hypothetical protein